MRVFVPSLGLLGLALARPPTSDPVASAQHHLKRTCSVKGSRQVSDCVSFSGAFIEVSAPSSTSAADVQVLEDAFHALAVMQKNYFDIDYGTWTTAIDWTAAVAGTVVTGMLSTLSTSLTEYDIGGVADFKGIETLVSTYYSQVIMSYFNQDVLAIRGQAYDDMLWVVLQWLEGIQLVATHSTLHYPGRSLHNATTTNGLIEALETLPWHGNSWVPSFAHRSRIFWNLASHGWGTDLCHGGMTWNPNLEPYKNSITNQLYIAASISMYRNFPGDNFTAPWLTGASFPERDPAHLAAAVDGYEWLRGVNMTNNQGLYVDGYHIDSSIPGNVECDVRDEMVYTYNQGVVLSGLRGLWAVSGEPSYVEDGHVLIQAVILATGWDLENQAPVDDVGSLPPGELPPWRGLGRAGIMEEECDASGECSQDAQTFKGIYFHHLLAFCSDFEPPYEEGGSGLDMDAYKRILSAHDEACRAYVPWLECNAGAALQTRNAEGLFGAWWGAPLYGSARTTTADDGIEPKKNATDYRNEGTPSDEIWGTSSSWMPGGVEGVSEIDVVAADISIGDGQETLDNIRAREIGDNGRRAEDLNDRGRGRTVETQIGGLAVLRAYWELSRLLGASR